MQRPSDQNENSRRQGIAVAYLPKTVLSNFLSKIAWKPRMWRNSHFLSSASQFMTRFSGAGVSMTQFTNRKRPSRVTS
jgi:hypothetical protein